MKKLPFFIFLTVIIACVQLTSAADNKQDHSVTFNVNMAEAEGFDPEEHTVYITGSFTGWAEPGSTGSLEMSPVIKNDHNLIYTVTSELPAGQNEYKYFSDAFGAGWAGGEWAGDPNRVIMVTGNAVINNTWGILEEDNVYTVAFEIINEAGDPVNDAIITFGNTDYEAGVYVFENVSPNTYNYAVAKDGYITHHGQLDVIDEDVDVTVVLEEGDTPVHQVMLLINMHDAASGETSFDPAIHDVYVSGTFNDWTPPGEDESYMLQASQSDDGWHALQLELEYGNHDYKYFFIENEASWDFGEWDGGSDRTIFVNENMPVFNLFGTPEINAVSFTVSDTEGNEISDAVIKINSTESDPGKYVFNYIAPGHYEFSIIKAGYLTYTDTFEMADGDLSIHIALEPDDEPAYTVSFVVTDDEGATIPDAIITLHNETNAPGDYIFENMLPGTYNVEVARDGFETHEGQVSVSDEDVTVEVALSPIETTAIQNLSAEIAVYPNPAVSTVFINANDEIISNVMLIDMLGRVIYEATVLDSRHELDVADLQNGIYFVRISTDKQLTTRRIIVNN